MPEDTQISESLDSSSSEQNGGTANQEEKQTSRRARPQINYPPYVNGYGAISDLFETHYVSVNVVWMVFCSKVRTSMPKCFLSRIRRVWLVILAAT
jgi:hypothetical protein